MLTSPFRDGAVPKPRVVSHATHKERQHDVDGDLSGSQGCPSAPGVPDLGNLPLSKRLRLKRLLGDLTGGQLSGYGAVDLRASEPGRGCFAGVSARNNYVDGQRLASCVKVRTSARAAHRHVRACRQNQA
jgi:hypothetical protein